MLKKKFDFTLWRRYRLYFDIITYKKILPDEIYNLAAQSHVAVSFEVPEYTANADALGCLENFRSYRFHKLQSKTRFYQAGTSEMYGKVIEVPQNEKTSFYPRSPYGVSKVYAHWITINYREAYNIFACNGILFNHESPRRRYLCYKKIVSGLCRVKFGLEKTLYLGNLDAKRDGVMQKIMFTQCGKCFKNEHLKIM